MSDSFDEQIDGIAADVMKRGGQHAAALVNVVRGWQLLTQQHPDRKYYWEKLIESLEVLLRYGSGGRSDLSSRIHALCRELRQRYVA